MFDWKMMIRQLLKIFDVRRIYSRIKIAVKSNLLFCIAFFGYIIVLSTITILKHNAFLTSGFDLGLVNQAFSTTLSDGKLFYETGDLSFNPGGSFFGVHFSPILVLLLPFYAICPCVENLLVMQTVILALGAIPIYWMSRDRFGKRIGAMVSTIYFIYPPLFLLNLNDIHLEPFTATFFMFSVYYLEKEDWKKVILFSVLAMMTLEFAPIIGVFMAFYGLWFLYRKRFKDSKLARKYLFVIILVSIVFFLVALKSKEAFNTYTSPLPSPFHHVLANPAGVMDVFLDDLGTKVLYLINLLAPLAFLPLLAPEPLVMALPWLLASSITSVSAYYSVYFQYTGFVIPFIFLALPKAIERLKPQKPQRILYVMMLSTLLIGLYLPSVQEAPWNNKFPVTNEHTDLIHMILPLIPAEASVLTQNDIFPHLSNRPNAYMYIPNSSDIKTDFILVDVDSPWYSWIQPSQFGERNPPSNRTIEVLQSGEYGVYAAAKSVILLKKGYNGNPVLYIPFDTKYNYATINRDLTVSTVVEDPTSSSKLVLYHDHEEDEGGVFWYGPYVSLLPGLYRVTYAMKVHSYAEIDGAAQIIEVDVTNASGASTLKEAMVNGSSVPAAGQWFNYTLLFAVDTPINGVECRGIIWGDYSVSFDYVRLEQIVPQPIAETVDYGDVKQKSVFYSEELPAEQGMISDGVMTHVRGGIMTHVDGKGTFWNGPYVSLPKGNYIAKFWLKLDKPYDADTVLLDVDIATDAGSTRIAFLTLHGFNFEEVNEWKSFDVNFTLQNDTDDVEFRGYNVKELAPISFLAVEVYPDTSLSFSLIHKTTFNATDLPVVKGTASKDGTLTHTRGNGTFWRGPYMTLPKGEYVVRFWLKLNKPYDGVLLDVDVATDGGSTQIEFLTLSGFNFGKVDKWQSFDIKFTLQNDTNSVEFRGINVKDAAPISLQEISVYQEAGSTQEPIDKRVFYSADLQVDQGIVVKSGAFWSGPYTNLPKGEYRARVWLRLDEPYNGTLLDIEVTTNSGNTKVTALTVHSSNFEGVGKWQKFELEFTLQRSVNIVEVRGVNVGENAPVSLVAVEVFPDTSLSAPLIYNATFNYEDMSVVQGIVDPASGIMTHTEGSGVFWHGPYVNLQKGDYIARFWLKLNEPYNGTLIDVDVATNRGLNATFLTLSGSNFGSIDKWQSFDVQFTLQNDINNVELRGINVRDTAPISFLAVEVFPDASASQPTPAKVFYSKDLVVIQGTVAENGIMTHAEGSGVFWQGPYVPMRKGDYVAKFWLKLDKPYNADDVLLDLDVATDAGSTRIEFLTLHGFNFGSINTWQSFEIKFTLQNTTNIVEFRGIYVRDTAPISLQSIEVYPDTG